MSIFNVSGEIKQSSPSLLGPMMYDPATLRHSCAVWFRGVTKCQFSIYRVVFASQKKIRGRRKEYERLHICDFHLRAKDDLIPIIGSKAIIW